jgi:hypothetical protein
MFLLNTCLIFVVNDDYYSSTVGSDLKQMNPKKGDD